MLDVKLLRENPDVIRKDLRKRGWLDKLPLVDEASAADSEWRQAKKRVDDLRHAQNKLTAEIAALKKAGKDPKEKLAEVKGIPEEIASLEKRAQELQARVREILMSLPNILHESVPVGSGRERERHGEDLGRSRGSSISLRRTTSTSWATWVSSTWRGLPRSPGPGSSS